MRVRALKNIAPGHGIFSPGSIFDLEDNQAKNLIASGAVEAVEAQTVAPVAEEEAAKKAAEEDGESRGEENKGVEKIAGDEDRALEAPAENRMQRGKSKK